MDSESRQTRNIITQRRKDAKENGNRREGVQRCYRLKGGNRTAQGNALGHANKKWPSP